MYNCNSVDGKLARINELKNLISKIGDIPGTFLSYTDAEAISNYLIDVKSDLEKQVKHAENLARRQARFEKTFRYHFIDEHIVVCANSGDEAAALFRSLTGQDSTGRIEITNLVTGNKNIMYPVKIL